VIPDPAPRWFLRTPWLHPVVIDYAEHGMVVFVVLLIVGWWIARGSHDRNLLAAAIWAPMGALAAVGINQPIVSMVAAARPYAVLPDIVVLTDRGSDPSFPSSLGLRGPRGRGRRRPVAGQPPPGVSPRHWLPQRSSSPGSTSAPTISTMPWAASRATRPSVRSNSGPCAPSWSEHCVGLNAVGWCGRYS
jgi:hypothetical protein